jgi:hypothetical protein
MKKKSKNKIDQEIRQRQKFSLSAGIAKESSGMFQGASMVPLNLRLRSEIKQYIRLKVSDPEGSLLEVLEQKINDSDQVITKFEKSPLSALKSIITAIVSNDTRLCEFVRQIDQHYGRQYQERPHFQAVGQEPHVDDNYTHQSVLLTLESLLKTLDEIQF